MEIIEKKKEDSLYFEDFYKVVYRNIWKTRICG